MNKILILFIILSVANVVIQTIKSICTIKCGKGVAALVNAIAFGLYTVVIVYTNADFPLWEKVIITALVNLVGVYLVKLAEEKMRKDKLWLVEFTIKNSKADEFETRAIELNLPTTRIETSGAYTVFKIYCATQKESLFAKELADRFNAKYFVTESKSL